MGFRNPVGQSSRDLGQETQDLSRHGSLSCAPLSSGLGVRISQMSRSRNEEESNSTGARRGACPFQRSGSAYTDEVLLETAPNPSHVPSTSAGAAATTAEDSDEVELLGVHPIVKPPPLAVITLSSDEEEDAEEARRLKTEMQGPRVSS